MITENMPGVVGTAREGVATLQNIPPLGYWMVSESVFEGCVVSSKLNLQSVVILSAICVSHHAVSALS